MKFNLFKEDSPTFHKGQIGSYLDHFTDEAYKNFYSLPQDFMKQLGYDFDDMNNPPVLPKRTEEFRKRALTYSESVFDNTPITVLYNFIGHNIVKYKREYYIIPQRIGAIDLTKEKNGFLKKLETARSINEAKQKIIQTRQAASPNALMNACKSKLKRFLSF